VVGLPSFFEFLYCNITMIPKLSKEPRFAGQMAVFATAFLWSTSGLTIKLVEWHPMVITSFRSLVAVVFLLVFRQIVPPPKNSKNAPFPFLAGAFLFSFCMITFIVANTLTTSANAILLQYGAPVWAALLGWLLVKEKPHWEHWGALVFVFGGLFIFFRGSLGAGSLMGDGIAVLSGIFLGAYTVFLRMMKHGNPRDAILLAHVISVIIGLPFIFLYPPAFEPIPVMSILFMGIMQAGLAAVFFSYGIKRVTAVQAMLITAVEPILNPLWVFLATGERPSAAAFTGGAIIIFAVLSSSLIGWRRDEKDGLRANKLTEN
jgi:drug/metabolite transporter (DMT)-like permease